MTRLHGRDRWHPRVDTPGRKLPPQRSRRLAACMGSGTGCDARKQAAILVGLAMAGRWSVIWASNLARAACFRHLP